MVSAGSLAVLAQTNNYGQILFTTATPTGTCNQGQAWIVMPSGSMYVCQNSAPVSVPVLDVSGAMVISGTISGASFSTGFGTNVSGMPTWYGGTSGLATISVPLVAGNSAILIAANSTGNIATTGNAQTFAAAQVFGAANTFNAANTFTAGLQDFGGATLKLPASTTAPTTTALISYNSTAGVVTPQLGFGGATVPFQMMSAAATTAASATVTIPSNATVITLTGTTSVTGATGCDANHAGKLFTMIFTTQNGTASSGANFFLNGTFTASLATPHASLTLRCDAANWVEVGRSAGS